MCTSRSGFRRVAQVKEGPASHDDARYRERSLMSTICSHLPSLAARLRSQGFELGEPGVLPHSHAAGQSNVVNVVCSARPSPPRKHVCVCLCGAGRHRQHDGAAAQPRTAQGAWHLSGKSGREVIDATRSGLDKNRLLGLDTNGDGRWHTSWVTG